MKLRQAKKILRDRRDGAIGKLHPWTFVDKATSWGTIYAAEHRIRQHRDRQPWLRLRLSHKLRRDPAVRAYVRDVERKLNRPEVRRRIEDAASDAMLFGSIDMFHSTFGIKEGVTAAAE